MHGGGLVMSATNFHMSFLKCIQEAAAGDDDESFAVAILAYGEYLCAASRTSFNLTLACLEKCPDAPYPSQLGQLVELLVYLMTQRATQDVGFKLFVLINFRALIKL